MLRLPSTGVLYALYASVCGALLGFGLYLEHVQGLVPCSLCWIQRAFFLLIMMLAVLGAYRAARGYRHHPAVPLLIVVFALLGVAVASRQLWLQHMVTDVAYTCGPDLGYLLKVLPLTEVLIGIFRGDGNCAEVLWRFLGLSIPGWSLIFFLCLGTGSVFLARQAWLRI